MNINLRSGFKFRSETLFQNDGVLNLYSGIFELAPIPGTPIVHSGSWYHAPGTEIRLLAGTHSFDESSVVYDGKGFYFYCVF